MTYEYLCTDEGCGHVWEESQKIVDPVLTKCPKCGNETAKRMISGGQGFLLKDGGCGWYKNGYS
jgi:putative FmdB family regulatory protein